MPSSEYYYDPDPSDFDEEPREVTCKFCGKDGLHWHEGQKWALVDARGAIHFCRGPAAPEEFEAL
jgi:hypothetical protein